MSDTSYSKIIYNGLWTNNTAFVQLLGLCPLLAVSNTVINGLGLGLATTLILVASNMMVSMIRHWVRPEIRIPVFVLIIAMFSKLFGSTTIDTFSWAFSPNETFSIDPEYAIPIYLRDNVAKKKQDQ